MTLSNSSLVLLAEVLKREIETFHAHGSAPMTLSVFSRAALRVEFLRRVLISHEYRSLYDAPPALLLNDLGGMAGEW